MQAHISAWPIIVAELVLLEVGHALARIERDVAGGRLQHAGQDLHESGLARAVGADQAVAVAFAELDRDVFEKRLGAELDGDV
jgi:hypothetical protein